MVSFPVVTNIVWSGSLIFTISSSILAAGIYCQRLSRKVVAVLAALATLGLSSMLCAHRIYESYLIVTTAQGTNNSIDSATASPRFRLGSVVSEWHSLDCFSKIFRLCRSCKPDVTIGQSKSHFIFRSTRRDPLLSAYAAALIRSDG